MQVFKILCSVSAGTVYDSPCHQPACYVESILVHQWKTSWQQWSSVIEKHYAKKWAQQMHMLICSENWYKTLKILSLNLTVNLYFFFLVKMSWFQIYVFCGSSQSLHVSWNYSIPNSLHVPSNSSYSSSSSLYFPFICLQDLLQNGYRVFPEGKVWPTFTSHLSPHTGSSSMVVFQNKCNHCGPGSSVSTATNYGLDGLGLNPGGDEIFRPSRPALEPTQPPAKWAPGLSHG